MLLYVTLSVFLHKEMMNSALKTRKFVSEMRKFVSEMRELLLKTMNFAAVPLRVCLGIDIKLWSAT